MSLRLTAARTATSKCTCNLNFGLTWVRCTSTATNQVQRNEELLEILAGEKLQAIPYRQGATNDLIAETQKQASNTASQSHLPQSPLTDPRLTKARRDHKTPKARPLKFQDLSPWRKQLYRNPYAQALASPTRHCMLTGAHVPKAFLLSFGLITHPETGRIWHMPRFIAEARKGPRAKNLSALALREETKNVDNNDQEDVRAQDAQAMGENRSPRFRTGSSIHVLNSDRAMRIISSRSVRNFRKLIPGTWLSDSGIDINKLVWREDMPDFVLKHTRRRIFENIEALAKSSSDLFERVKDWDSLGDHKQIGAVLWFPNQEQIAKIRQSSSIEGMSGSTPTRESPADRSSGLPIEDNTAEKDVQQKTVNPAPDLIPAIEAKQSEESQNGEGLQPKMFKSIPKEILDHDLESQDEIEANQQAQLEDFDPDLDPPPSSTRVDSAAEIPPAYAMVEWRQVHVPVYNMPFLFGHELSAELRQRLDVAAVEGGLVVFRSKRRTTEILMKLWNLMGYLADGDSVQWDGK